MSTYITTQCSFPFCPQQQNVEREGKGGGGQEAIKGGRVGGRKRIVIHPKFALSVLCLASRTLGETVSVFLNSRQPQDADEGWLTADF